MVFRWHRVGTTTNECKATDTLRGEIAHWDSSRSETWSENGACKIEYETQMPSEVICNLKDLHFSSLRRRNDGTAIYIEKHWMSLANVSYSIS